MLEPAAGPSCLPAKGKQSHSSATGACVLIVYTAIVKYCMTYTRYVCLLSRSDRSTQDQLGFLVQRLNGWFEPTLFDVELYVDSRYAYLLYCIDPNLEPLPQRDYIV